MESIRVILDSGRCFSDRGFRAAAQKGFAEGPQLMSAQDSGSACRVGWGLPAWGVLWDMPRYPHTPSKAVLLGRSEMDSFWG